MVNLFFQCRILLLPHLGYSPESEATKKKKKKVSHFRSSDRVKEVSPDVLNHSDGSCGTIAIKLLYVMVAR